MDEQISTITTTATMADNLVALSELLKQHPELPAPYITSSRVSGNVDANFYLHLGSQDRTLEEQREDAAAIVRSLDGEWVKSPDEFGEAFNFDQWRDWGRLHITVAREAVCERVVVGTETITIPATEAAVLEAEPERTEVREIVEWRCSSLLAPVIKDAETAAAVA